MKVYVFGNEDLSFDNQAIKIADRLEGQIEGCEFIFVKPNQDLPFVDEKNVVIMDTVEGLDDVEIFGDIDLGKFSVAGKTTAHDFDLGFQLKYLKKLGKIGKVMIIGLPMEKEVSYLRIQSILRKLVAQDMHGS